LNCLEDTAHHLSVLLLYAFRQQSSSSYWYSYAVSGILCHCGKTAGLMKTPLGTEVDLRAGYIVLDRFPALRKGAQHPLPLFGPCLLWSRSPISATAELLYSLPKTAPCSQK